MQEVIERNGKNRPFIIYFGTVITYNDFEMYSNAIASQFSMYCDSGDRIAIISENIPQYIIAQYAAWKNNCIFVPLSPLDSTVEIQEKINLIKPSVLIISSEFYSQFKNINTEAIIISTDPQTFGELPDNLRKKFALDKGKEELNIRKKLSYLYEYPDNDDIAMLVFTSGTSGKQKAAEIRHKNIYAASYIYKEWFKVKENDINLGMAPFFHITGLTFGISLTALTGSSIILNYRFEPENTLELIDKYHPTITMFVATAYKSMINSWKDKTDIKKRLLSMRMWSSGGMPVSIDIENGWKNMTGRWIYLAYGLTESTSPVALWKYPYNGQLKLYKNIVAAGLPVYYTSTRRGRSGELIVSGPQIIDGYYMNKEDTEKTFYRGEMKTGDICYIDKDGWIFIVDRKKDLIDVSGYKVWPGEIENVIRKSSYVDDSIVVAKKDEYKGEVPVAYVKLKDNVFNIESARSNIIEICRSELSRFKIPAEIIFIDAMPVSATGKIKRSDIKKILEMKK